MRHVKTAIARLSLVIALIAGFTRGGIGASTTADWNGIRIRGTADGGQATVHPAPEHCRIELEFGDGRSHTVTLQKDELWISSDALGIKTPRRHKIKGCVEATIVAT